MESPGHFSSPGRLSGKWFKFLGNELFLQTRPGHSQNRAGRRRIGQWTPGSLFPVAGASAFPGREGALGYFNSLVGINKFLSHVIEKVPASVGKGALKESQCNEADARFLKILKCILWLQPEVLSCGHKGQEAAQRDQSEAWQPLASLVWFPPLPAVMIQLFVLSPVSLKNWRSATNRRREMGLEDLPDLVTISSMGVQIQSTVLNVLFFTK